MLAHRLDVAGLPSAARRDPALAGVEPGLVAPQAQALVVDFGLRQPHRRLDRGGVDLVAAFQPVIEAGQRQAGDLGGRGGSGDREPVAARHQRYAELPLDAVEMLVALAIKRRQQQIVVEFELAAPGGGDLGGDCRRNRAHARCSAIADCVSITPARLLGWVARIVTGTISPIRAAPASAWTLCR